MAYDKDSFLAGLTAGRTLRGTGGGSSGETKTHIIDIGAGPFVPDMLDFSKYKPGDVVMVVSDSVPQGGA